MLASITHFSLLRREIFIVFRTRHFAADPQIIFPVDAGDMPCAACQRLLAALHSRAFAVDRSDARWQ